MTSILSNKNTYEVRKDPEGIVQVCGGNIYVLQKEVDVHSQGHMFKIYGTLGNV